MSPHRLSEFSDGIFAISATLLVLNFVVPPIGNPDSAVLTTRLLQQWPRLLAFLLSFGVVINYWRVHSALFLNVKQIDHKTMMLNVAWLVVAAFVPYATNVAGTYPMLAPAAVLYSLTLLVPALVGFALSRHLVSSNSYHNGIPPAAIDAAKRIKLAVYIRIIGLAFAFFLPVVSYVIYWIVIIYYMMLPQFDIYAEIEEHA